MLLTLDFGPRVLNDVGKINRIGGLTTTLPVKKFLLGA